MALTSGERALFSAGQLTQLDRIPNAKLEGLFLSKEDPDNPGNQIPLDAQERAAVLNKWVPRSAEQLRSRVNIDSRSQSSVNFSTENDYNAAEMQEINDGFANGQVPNLNGIPNFLTRSGGYAGANVSVAGPPQTGIGATYEKITQFDQVGDLLNCTIGNNAVTVQVSGIWTARFALSFSGSNSTTFQIAIHVNGNEIVKSRTIRKLATGGDVGSCTGFATGRMSAGSVVDIRVKTIGINNTLLLEAGNFELSRIR